MPCPSIVIIFGDVNGCGTQQPSSAATPVAAVTVAAAAVTDAPTARKYLVLAWKNRLQKHRSYLLKIFRCRAAWTTAIKVSVLCVDAHARQRRTREVIEATHAPNRPFGAKPKAYAVRTSMGSFFFIWATQVAVLLFNSHFRKRRRLSPMTTFASHSPPVVRMKNRRRK